MVIFCASEVTGTECGEKEDEGSEFNVKRNGQGYAANDRRLPEKQARTHRPTGYGTNEPASQRVDQPAPPAFDRAKSAASERPLPAASGAPSPLSARARLATSKRDHFCVRCFLPLSKFRRSTKYHVLQSGGFPRAMIRKW